MKQVNLERHYNPSNNMDIGLGAQKRTSQNRGPAKVAPKKLPGSRTSSNNDLTSFPVLKGGQNKKRQSNKANLL